MSSPRYSPSPADRTSAAAAASSSATASTSSNSLFSSAASSLTGSTSSISGSLSSLGGSKPSLLSSSGRSLSGSGAQAAARAGSGSSENLPPRTLARVARDVRDLVKNPPEGVRLVLDDETGMPGSLSEILAEIEGPEQTPYHSRYFQLKLVLSADFPATPPRGYFLTKIYHPNVDPTTGAICVNTLKRDWTPSTSLGHVLTVVRCLLIVPFPESSLNDEAGKNFMESYDEYARRARLLAGVHGLKGWSSEAYAGGGGGGGGKKGGEGGDRPAEDGEGKKKGAADHGLPNGSSASPGDGRGGSARLGKMGSRSNIARGGGGGKGMDKKSKKKSLRRL